MAARLEMDLTSAERLLAVAACIAIGNGAAPRAAARIVGVHGNTLRAWMRRPWWPRISALADQALPASDRRSMLRRKAEGVLHRHLDDGSLRAAEVLIRTVGLFDEAPSADERIRVGEQDLTELSTQDLARLAMPD